MRAQLAKCQQATDRYLTEHIIRSWWLLGEQGHFPFARCGLPQSIMRAMRKVLHGAEVS